MHQKRNRYLIWCWWLGEGVSLKMLKKTSVDFLKKLLDREELSNASEEKQVFDLGLVVR